MPWNNKINYSLILAGLSWGSEFKVLSCISEELARTAIALNWAKPSHKPRMLCMKSTMCGGMPIEAMVSILVGPTLRRRLTRLKRNIERGMAGEREREGAIQ